MRRSGSGSRLPPRPCVAAIAPSRSLGVWCAALILVLSVAVSPAAAQPQPEDAIISVMLGSPTDRSITANVLARRDLEFRIEYFDGSMRLLGTTPVMAARPGAPVEVRMDGLAPDARHVYRVQYREPGVTAFEAGPEHGFHTQRRPGSPFVFTVQADSHLGDPNTSTELYGIALRNAAGDVPDFHVDLGDTFMNEKYFAGSRAETWGAYLAHRDWFDLLCRSVPLFLVNGNHEGELGWRLDGMDDNLAIWSVEARRAAYPNPEPGPFYSGSVTPEPFTGVRDGYYAWTWGDALFVVLDPFWYTRTRPRDDGWAWTLGFEQYRWLREVLSRSDAPFKFVFAHQLVGGNGSEARGGVEAAGRFEWGGAEANGTRGFETRRPGWARPIHDVLVENHVTVFFHGHDHLYARQELDGVVYLEVPRPNAPSQSIPSDALDYGYATGLLLPSSGHLRVAVTSEGVTVEYVWAVKPGSEREGRRNGEVADRYFVPRSAAGTAVTHPPAALHPAPQSFPNPFVGSTTLRFGAEGGERVVFEILDALGRRLLSRSWDSVSAGTHETVWDASDRPAGVYFWRLVRGNQVNYGTFNHVR